MTGMTASIPAENSAPVRRGRGRPKAKPSDWEPFGSYLPAPLAREFRVICAHLGTEQRLGLRDAVSTWVEANRIPGYSPAADNVADGSPPAARGASAGSPGT